MVDQNEEAHPDRQSTMRFARGCLMAIGGKMRFMFIIIGLILILGGVASLATPRLDPASKTKALRDTADTRLGYSKDMTLILSCGAVAAGAIALGVGMRSSGQFSPPVKPIEEQDAGTGGWL
jgi:hypothetical protein